MGGGLAKNIETPNGCAQKHTTRSIKGVERGLLFLLLSRPCEGTVGDSSAAKTNLRRKRRGGTGRPVPYCAVGTVRYRPKIMLIGRSVGKQTPGQSSFRSTHINLDVVWFGMIDNKTT
jgi:hypothetical protein